jgi:hypothetical protein
MAFDWDKVLNSPGRKKYAAPIAAAAARVSKETGVPAELLTAAVTVLAGQESTFNAKARGELLDDKTRAQGLLQYRPTTAKARGIDPMDPLASIMAAATDAAKAYKRGGVAEIAASHFAGEGGAGRGPKTREYVRNFLDGMTKVGAPAYRYASRAAPAPRQDASPAIVEAPVLPELAPAPAATPAATPAQDTGNPFAAYAAADTGEPNTVDWSPSAGDGALTAADMQAPRAPTLRRLDTNPFASYGKQRDPDTVRQFEELIGQADG